MEIRKESIAIGLIAGAIMGTTIGIGARAMMKPKESPMKRASKNALKTVERFIDGMK